MIFLRGCRISIKSSHGHLKEFTFTESLQPNENSVVTMLKATDDGIELTTRRIGRPGVEEKKETGNDCVTKMESVRGKVIDLN